MIILMSLIKTYSIDYFWKPFMSNTYTRKIHAGQIKKQENLIEKKRLEALEEERMEAESWKEGEKKTTSNDLKKLKEKEREEHKNRLKELYEREMESQ